MLRMIHTSYSLSYLTIIYTRVYKNCGNDSGNFPPDDGCLCGTVVPENTVSRSKNVTTSIYLLLYCVQLGCTKYRIYSIKTASAKIIHIHKIDRRINYNTISIINTRQRPNYRIISTRTIKINVSQYIQYRSLVFIIQTQIMLKMLI